MTYTDQLNKLENDKELIIEDKTYAEKKLKNISYYALIGGYKSPFIDIHTHKYLGNTTFNDIVELRNFDENLRNLFFNYICKVEQMMRSLISYHFTSIYGEQQSTYLNRNNYNYTKHYKTGIDKLISMLDKMAKVNTDHAYIVYQRNKYGNVPLWVLVNALTFGQTSKMFEFLPQKIQGDICKEFENIQKNEMIQILKVLTLFRNVCAHNERLFSYKTYITFPDMELHKKLNIPQTGSIYTYGKDDLFGIVIALRYLLDKESFAEFKKELISLIKKYLKKSNRLSENELLSLMGFPLNWKKISLYKM